MSERGSAVKLFQRQRRYKKVMPVRSLKVKFETPAPRSISRSPSSYSKSNTNILKNSPLNFKNPHRRTQSQKTIEIPISSPAFAEMKTIDSITPRIRKYHHKRKISDHNEVNKLQVRRPQSPPKPSPRNRKITPQKPDLRQQVTQVQRQAVDESLLKTQSEIMSNHLFQIYQALLFIQTLPPVDLNYLRTMVVKLQRKTHHKKFVVFDLDETLVHWSDNSNAVGPEVVLPLQLPDGAWIEAGINTRPFLKELLVAAGQNFEVIVFTASAQCYADAVLDHLDPTQSLIHHRYYRDNCICVNGTYIKDLRILNVDLRDVVIVDNAVYSFAFQLDNGIPIVSWFDNENDKELSNLIGYLSYLSKVDDVRIVNRQNFRMRSFVDEYREQIKQ